MSKEKLVPRLRFREFFDNTFWNKKELKEVAFYRNGKAHENDIADEGNFIVVNSKFVSTNGSVKKYTNNQNEPLFKDEIAFVLSDVPNGRAIARTYLVTKDNTYTLNQRIAGITPRENTNSYFLYNLMNRNPYFLEFDDGVKQTNLSKSDVKKFYSFYPTKKEQNKIGAFFEKIDEMIQLQQSKVNKLKDVKSAYLFEMFPKEGEKYPKKRFKEFIEPWGKIQFNEITEYITSSLSANNALIQGKYKLYDANELIGYINSFGQEQDYVTVIKDGSGVGRVRLLPKHSNFIGTMGAIINKDNVDISYIYAYLQQFNFTEYITGATVPHVYYRDYGESFDYHPNYKEQVKIGQFFESLDKQISVEEEKLAKLEKLKQGYLNDMFV